MTTKELLTNTFETWARTGSMDAWLARLSDELVWTVAGSKENSGVYRGKQNYIDNVLGRLNKWVKAPPVPKLKKLLVDGEWATALLHADAQALDGSNFAMDYCWLIRVESERIVEVIGFYA